MTLQERFFPLATVEGEIYSRPTQAVILAGGRGERMRPLTDDKPKAMIPIGGRPFLEYQVEQLRDQGFKQILLLLGYKPEVIQNHFGDGSRWGIRIDYEVTAPEQLTGSRVAAARSLIERCFLLLYCDNYWPMQIERLWARFCEAAKPGLITVYSNKDEYSRGSVCLDSRGHVKVFDRLRRTAGLREVEISYAVLTSRVLDLLPADDTLFEEAVYTPLAQQGRLTAFVSDHRYYSVGSLHRLPSTEQFFRSTPTIILDRDGVLNVRPARGEYVCKANEWKWRSGSLEALRLLCAAGYRVLVATNQPGIAREMLSPADVNEIHSRMQSEATLAGGRIDDVFYCPHGWDEGCECRKPKPGLLYAAQRKFHLDLTKTVFIGDEERDAQAAGEAGCQFYRLADDQSLLDIVERFVSQRK